MRQITIFLLILSFASCSSVPPSIKGLCENKKVVVGGLFGISSHSRDPFTPAMNLCRDQANAQFANTGFSVEVRVVDTANNEDKTLTAFNKMIASQDVNVIVGPDDSKSLLFVGPQAKVNDIAFISPSATNPSIGGTPNVFSISPSDTYQGKLLAQLMNSPTTIVGIHRGLNSKPDPYATALRDAIMQALPGVQYPWFGYDPSDLSTINADFFKNSVVPALTKTSPIMLIAFSADGTAVLKVAANYPITSGTDLSTYQWFAPDGLALSADLPADTQAAAFAKKVGLKATAFGFSNTAQAYVDFQKAITAAPYNAVLPNVYSTTTYDACVLAVKAAKAIYDEGCTASASWDDTVKSISAQTTGATGNLALGDNGIRIANNYAVWGIEQQNSSYVWKQKQFCSYVSLSSTFDCVPAQ